MKLNTPPEGPQHRRAIPNCPERSMGFVVDLIAVATQSVNKANILKPRAAFGQVKTVCTYNAIKPCTPSSVCGCFSVMSVAA